FADHGDHAILAPGREPAHVVAGGHGLVLEGVHGAEPLGRGAEDDGAFAAPAVGIGVDDLFLGKEHAGFLHVLEDDGITFLGLETGVLAGVVGVATLVVHGHHHVHAVAQAGLVVVGA